MSTFRMALFSSLLTLLLFLTVSGNGFVALDDFAYIVNNQHIATLDWETFLWALTAFHEGNWHPLTMLSLALDRSLWGLNPFGFHLTNVVVHSGTVFCVCYLFESILDEARLGRNSSVRPYASGRMLTIAAATGAILFGIHPLRVESVVWASERKDVLCLFFLTTSLWWYLRYYGQCHELPGKSFYRFKSYWAALLLAGCALFSKPTAVSLPFVMLIIDWYPLERLTTRISVKRTLLEKLPFLLLSLIGVILTLSAQQVAIDKAPQVELSSRLLVACKALLFYLVKSVWPSNLTAFYLHPGDVAESSRDEYLLYLFAVALLVTLLIKAGRRQPLWPALGMFYCVTLAPMVGLVQVGGQWAADRYSYLPALGLSLVWGWGVVWVILRLRQEGHLLAMKLCVLLAVCQFGAYSLVTLRQIKVWRDTETLASRIIELSPLPSGAAYHARAIYRFEVGKYEQAHADITEAMKIALRGNLKKAFPELAMTQARILDRLGRYAEALAAADWAVEKSVAPLPMEFLMLRRELGEKAASAGTVTGTGQGGR